MGRLREALRKCSLNSRASCCLICIQSLQLPLCICTTDSDRSTDVVGKRIKSFECGDTDIVRYSPGSAQIPWQ